MSNTDSSAPPPSTTNESIKFRIRDARPTDCVAIHALICKLAAFEKMPDQVKITPEQLQEDAFGEGHPPRFGALIVERIANSSSDQEKEDEVVVEVVGYAIYTERYSTWKGRTLWLEDLYIEQQHRQHGLGGGVFRKLAQLAQQEGHDRIEWCVLGWNKPAIDFYQHYGAIDLTEQEQWHMYRLSKSKYCELLQTPFKHTDTIVIE